jgi:predicted porin
MYGQASYDSDTAVAGNLLTPARVQYINDLYDGNRDTWAIGVDYNFSKRTTAYMLYTAVSDDQNNIPDFPGQSALPAPSRTDWDGFSIGMMHSF